MTGRIDFPPYDIFKISEEISDEEIASIPGALEAGKRDIDSITFSIILARAEGIMSEMTETILATARNPILYGAKDFTVYRQEKWQRKGLFNKARFRFPIW